MWLMVDEVDDGRHEVESEKDDGGEGEIVHHGQNMEVTLPLHPWRRVSAKRWLLRGLTWDKLQP